MDFSFDSIDFTSININKNKNKNNDNDNDNTDNTVKYDLTTTETYRIKRLFKIDPLTDQEVSDKLAFKYPFEWNPYTGIKTDLDPIGPMYFNACDLYDYYYLNRFKGLYNPPQDQFQGYYGDLIGSGTNIHIKSRGSNPEKYLFRLPIIDCYLPPTHNYSIITMGPVLTNEEIDQIDLIVSITHPKRTHQKFTSLKLLKYYYDCALEPNPDQNSNTIKELKNKFPNLSTHEINEKYNRNCVDILVNTRY